MYCAYHGSETVRPFLPVSGKSGEQLGNKVVPICGGRNGQAEPQASREPGGTGHL